MKPNNPQQWVVTGAAGGIGGAVRAMLEHDGHAVSGWDAGPSARSGDIQVDVSDPEAVARAAATIEAPIDGVVHCAGILSTGMATSIDVQRQLDMVRVNLGGTICLAHALAPLVRDGGSIVLLGSASGFQGPPEYATYAATKAGVATFADALRLELASRRVHVATCTPLFTDTGMIRMPDPPALLRTMGAVHTTDDVARSIMRGIRRRRAYILPGARVRALHAAWRVAGWSGPLLMRLMWQRARRT